MSYLKKAQSKEVAGRWEMWSPGRSLEAVEVGGGFCWSPFGHRPVLSPRLGLLCVCLQCESPAQSRKRALEGPTLLLRLFHFLSLPWV